MTQIKTQPPTFLLFARHADKIQPHYEAYLMNGIREAFGFSGTPLRIYYRSADAKSEQNSRGKRKASRKNEGSNLPLRENVERETGE